MHLDDVNDHLNTELDSEDYDSLGGFIIEHLDRLPVAGDEVITEEGIRLIVEKLDKNRIEKVHVYLPETLHVSRYHETAIRIEPLSELSFLIDSSAILYYNNLKFLFIFTKCNDRE